jgi:hypothetical protein
MPLPADIKYQVNCWCCQRKLPGSPRTCAPISPAYSISRDLRSRYGQSLVWLQAHPKHQCPGENGSEDQYETQSYQEPTDEKENDNWKDWEDTRHHSHDTTGDPLLHSLVQRIDLIGKITRTFPPSVQMKDGAAKVCRGPGIC